MIDEYIVTLDQIYGLSSFRIISHDENEIKLSKKTNITSWGQYVWAMVTISNDLNEYLDRDYIEISVHSELFKGSSQTSKCIIYVSYSKILHSGLPEG